MKKEESHFGEDANMFCIGAFVGMVVAACFIINYYNGSNKKQGKIIQAYEQYYKNTETLLDSLDSNLDLMDTDLCTDYGANYLNAKNAVDSLTNKNKYYEQ
jgi:hypothetical protein